MHDLDRLNGGRAKELIHEESPMRIEVVGEDSISQQARIYAEYRLFAALSHIVESSRVRHARLMLRRTKHQRAFEGVSCTVIVDIEGGDALRIRTSGDHPYAAINRAVERLKNLRSAAGADDHSPAAHAAAE